jgi:hypothetical protein
MNQRSTPAPEGETEEQAAVRIETDKYTSPLTDSIVFKFHKVPEQSLSWQFVISLTHEDGYKGVGNETLVEYLYDRLVVADFFEFGYRNEVFRVRSAQSAGDRGTGWDDRGNYNVNIVEVRTGPDREGDITLYVDSE